MKTSLLTFFLVAGILSISKAQNIPVDSLYLGQTPPGSIPQVFPLPVSPGSFAAERIAISEDNKEIYYTEIQGYFPTNGDTIRYFRYSGNHWTGPFNLFSGYLAPCLSISSDTMYIQNNSLLGESFYSVRNGDNWGNPKRFLSGLTLVHYFQETNNGHAFISTIPGQTTGVSDWCTIDLGSPDSTAVTLGLPLNTPADNLDFFVARDESFMILARNGMNISYHKDDGSWTNPKSLGPQINFGLGAWGPYVSADHQYLFYTTGVLPNYSDTYVYWAKIDELMDSLRYTNFVPYQKNIIPQQEVIFGEFFSYTIPDSTYVDDDGNHTLTYSAKMLNGGPLPAWMTFDSITATFSGIPDQLQTITIRIKATDDAGAFANANLKMVVKEFTSTNDWDQKMVRVFPNPSRENFRISILNGEANGSFVQVSDLAGKIVFEKKVIKDELINMRGMPAGIYVLKVRIGEKVVIRKICLE